MTPFETEQVPVVAYVTDPLPEPPVVVAIMVSPYPTLAAVVTVSAAWLILVVVIETVAEVVANQLMSPSLVAVTLQLLPALPG